MFLALVETAVKTISKVTTATNLCRLQPVGLNCFLHPVLDAPVTLTAAEPDEDTISVERATHSPGTGRYLTMVENCLQYFGALGYIWMQQRLFTRTGNELPLLLIVLPKTRRKLRRRLINEPIASVRFVILVALFIKCCTNTLI